MLAAAYVLQQHNELADKLSPTSSELLSEIVRIQRSIRGGNLDLVATAKLISQRVQKFTQADGVAIGIVTEDELIYLAAIGMAAHDIGRRVPRDSSLSAQCVRTRLTFQSPRTQEDPRMFSSLCDQTDVRSFIAVPVEYENEVVGSLEARFKTANAFRDDDVRNCELMAVLVKEVIAQAGQLHVGAAAPEVEVDRHPEPEISLSEEAVVSTETDASQSTDEKRDIPVAAPASAFQLSTRPRILPAAEPDEIVVAPVIKSSVDEPAAIDAALCRGCGQPLADKESFCGKCGTEKIIKTDGPLQSKWASLWYMNQARRTAEKLDVAPSPADEDPSSVSKPQPLPKAEASDLGETSLPSLQAIDSVAEVQDEAITTESAKPLVRLEWLPDIAESRPENWLRHQWRVNRANFYLAGASLLLIIALSGWGAVPALDSPNAPQLSLFDRMLVSLGIAEAPDAPVYRGNPDTPVWVDLHTALYYCPGSDLYGKTDGGKIATQRSAQMDQFEPAHRKACN